MTYRNTEKGKRRSLTLATRGPLMIFEMWSKKAFKCWFREIAKASGIHKTGTREVLPHAGFENTAQSRVPQAHREEAGSND